METVYMANSPPPGSDFWKNSAMLPPSPRYDVCGRNSTDYQGYQVMPKDYDTLPYISIRPTSPNYRDFQLMNKEKGSSDIADALLSLKHAVVHPQMGGPLSPGFSHLSQQFSPHGQGMGSSFSYCVGPPQGVVTAYGGPGSNSYTPPPQCHTDNVNTSTNTTGTQTQCNLFPSMSVNVSMSMNVGMPPNMPGQGNFTQDPWGAPHNPNFGTTPYGGPASPNIHIQTNYPTYQPQNQQYNNSFGFGESRETEMTAEAEDYYRSSAEEQRYQSVSRLYSFHAQLKHSKTPTPSTIPSTDHEKINLCRICGKTYARPSTLKTHLRTHSGEKPYKCTTCGKSFSQAANLTAHLRTHSGEKPFRCPVCDRRFSQSSSVTTHMRTHSGERPYRCRLCKKAFSDSSTLTKHLRIHSGEKPYQCKLCLLRFSQSGNLNRHMRIHNNTTN